MKSLSELIGRISVFVGAWFLSAGAASAQAGPWTVKPISAATVGGPVAVETGDVDGDGDLDVLAASVQGGRLAWYVNDAGDGSTWSEREIPTVTGNLSSAVPADVDGDGDLDVLYVNQGVSVRWAENTAGDGSAWSSQAITTTAYPQKVFAADVDGDADVDVLFLSTFSNDVFWVENTAGDGSTWSEHMIADAFPRPDSIAAADFDGDGDADLLVSSLAIPSSDPFAAWFENVSGDGSAWSQHDIPTSGFGELKPFVADVDGDGDEDWLASQSSSRRLLWFENSAGDGTVWDERIIATTPNLVFTISGGDFDGDGDVDAVSASFGVVAWYENAVGDGSEWFAHPVSTTIGSFNIIVSAGDVDGDGQLDVIAASPAERTVDWHANGACSTSGEFEVEQVIATPSMPKAALAGDVDGDGDLDAVSMVWGGFHHDVLWHENLAGDGSAWDLVTIDSGVIQAASTRTTLALGDVDGDGDLDALSGNFLENVWYENVAGDGSVWSTRTISAAPTKGQSIDVGDLDGDGDLDVISVSEDVDELYWHENTAGDGSAWTTRTVSTGIVMAKHASVADVDGDGDLDALSNSSYSHLAWHENVAGDGSVWTDRLIAATPITEGMAIAGDVDGDGDLDVLSHGGAHRITWFENLAGDGSTWSGRAISGEASAGQWDSLADLDGDGDLDVLSLTIDFLRWFENEAGDGSAWSEQVLSVALDDPPSAIPADLDRDGDLDVLSVSTAGHEIVWLENTAVRARQKVRLGTPPNPAAFLPGVTAEPTPGVLWDPVIDHTSFAPGAVMDFAIVSSVASNVPTPAGTFLCDRSAPDAFLVTNPSPGTPFAIRIPDGCGALGLRLCVQGGSLDAAGTLLLANALDVTVGTY